MFSKYEYAYALYQEGSFTKAAQKLFITQPSLSIAIKGIEKEAGAVLFERRGNGVVLTEAGKEYIATVERIMALEKELKSKIRDMNCLESGQLVVGGSNFISSYVLPGIINEFTKRYPKIEVELAEGNSVHMQQLLRQDRIDLLVDTGECPPECLTIPLAHEKILLCVPKAMAVNQGLEDYRIEPEEIFRGKVNFEKTPCVPLEKFKQEKFILLKPGNDMHERAMGIFRENDMEPAVAFRVDQLNMAYALAACGNGVTFVTDTLFRYGGFHEDVWLYPVAGQWERTLYIAHRHNRYCSRAMSEFILAAKQSVR